MTWIYLNVSPLPRRETHAREPHETYTRRPVKPLDTTARPGLPYLLPREADEMDYLNFKYVPADGFIGFSTDLRAGAWGLIDVTSFEGANQAAAQPLCEAPTVVTFKLELTWAIGNLSAAKAGAARAGERDRDWDDGQRRLRSLLVAANNDSDPKKRAASARLQKTLLLAGGVGQTRMKFHQEVDFGRKQALTVSSGEAAEDVALLGLGDVMAHIAKATDALAAAIGHGQGSDPPHERLAASLAECAAGFSAVSAQLSWLAQHGQTGADRARASELLAPLQALSARYPAPSPSAPGPADTPPPVEGAPAAPVEPPK